MNQEGKNAIRVMALSHKRHSDRLKSAATASFAIGRKALKDSQFPDQVRKPDGYVLRRPIEWR